MIVTGKKTVFCPTCEQEVILGRKNFEHIYHEVLCFLVIMTVGLGFFLYLILKYSKKKDRCPNCETQFDLQNLPESKILEKGMSN
ncbi:MAG: LITAF-like zinc ribbon domain-containing protein [Candidatus Lokiarchaeota archaeon]|nr:LITAF-like zinc ribbon domain-containing protein [Candidatus Lokiarchaeota archaeon]